MTPSRDPRVDPRPGDVVKPDAPWGYMRLVTRVTPSSVCFLIQGSKFVRRLATRRAETREMMIVKVAE